MNLHDMLQWWNLIYLAPLLVSLLWIVATVLTGAHGDVAHSGHGIGHDVIGHAVQGAVHGVEHAVHDVTHGFQHHGDIGHGAHAGAGHHGDVAHTHNGHAQGHGADHDTSTFARLMAVLGFGQVPITLLIGVFMLCWGSFGMISNQFFAAGLKYPAVYIWPSMGATFVISSAVTRMLAALIGRMMPKTETYGVSRFELVGALGKTVFATSENAGTVDIRDMYGTVHRVQAKTEPETEPIPPGSEVMVVDFDEDDKRYVVRRSEL